MTTLEPDAAGNAPLHASLTGAVALDLSRPVAVLLHGAGGNRSVWAIQARHLARQGVSVLAYDLPGHGRSSGPACDSVEAIAETVAADLVRRGVDTYRLAGHSMGSLVALELAARDEPRVDRLALLGAGLALAVNDVLLDATADDPSLAADAITEWAHSSSSHLGMGEAPGLWIAGAGRRTIAAEMAAHPGALHADFAACAAYDAGPAAAEAIACPALVISGSDDIMTPPRLGDQLATAIGAEHLTLEDCGHMMMAERPGSTAQALTAHLAA